MSKHTPGPWNARPIDPSGWVDIVREDGSAWPLPFAACKHFDQEANARLIAAAPDLLELLQEIAASDFYIGKRGGESTMRAKVEAAIAKATEAA